MNDKSEIRAAFLNFLEKKISSIKAELAAVKDAATSETKSSMGDKYETSREMMMQERNRLGSQLEIIMNQVAALNMIDVEKSHSEVAYGCLVKTEESTFFISTAAGQLKIGSQVVFAVSGEAPLSKAMMGAKVGDSFTFNHKSFKIMDVK